jgi:hypothetical protein
MRHWPPRCGYLWYRLMRIKTPHPDVNFWHSLCFANLFCTPLQNSIMIILGHRSMYIYFIVTILIYVVLHNVGTIVLSRLHLLRKYLMIFVVLQYLNDILKYFFGFDLGFIIIYLLKMFKWLLSL